MSIFFLSWQHCKIRKRPSQEVRKKKEIVFENESNDRTNNLEIIDDDSTESPQKPPSKS